ncbi:MAG: hypothetical protein N3B16_03905 [Candidatus Aminicenantes bacterium]|nr:hypothetical protein [Candidatus Aminicenantes bacterium]
MVTIRREAQGVMLIMLLILIACLNIGLMVAVPVWQTQIQREKEEELIFRGKQYVEAIRLYQLKHPGQFPNSLEILLKERFLRRPFKDPMTEEGEWDLILAISGPATQKGMIQRVMIAPPEALKSIVNPQIIGVVSRSKKKSIKIYNNQDTYDQWLFYYGQDPQKMPEIVRWGQKNKP